MMDLQWLKTVVMIILSGGLCLVSIVTAFPSITINGSSSTNRKLVLNDTMAIKCTIPSDYTSVIDLEVYRGSRTIKQFWGVYTGTIPSDYTSVSVRRDHLAIERFGNVYTGTTTKKITCDDNSYFYCSGELNGTYHSSSQINVTVECAPTWDEDVKEPVVFSSTSATFKQYYLDIIGHPQPQYFVQKFTSTGLQDIPLTIDVIRINKGVELDFYNYTEASYGVYQIVAKNTLGTFTTNITLRELIEPPKNLRAWSTTSTSIQLEWTAGEILETEQGYYIRYKTEGGTWRYHGSIEYNEFNVTYKVNSLQPNTTYYFLVQSYHNNDRSFYSNLAQATTLRPGDPPQTKPPIYQTVKPTQTTIGQTSLEPASSPGVTSSQPKTTFEQTTTSSPCVTSVRQEVISSEIILTFGAGIGIGIGVGLILGIIAVIGTVIYFKRSSVKRQDSPDKAHNKITKSKSDKQSENVDERSSHIYTGLRYDNKAYNETL